MTEEIIIDCTDCMYIDGNYCPNHDTKCDFVDCYYKQLKRLEQEKEMIISEYNKLLQEIIGGIEFKEIILSGITPLNVLKEMKKTYIQSSKYKSALEEIREIIEFAIEETLTLGQRNATDKILEIIKDVQNE